MVGHLVWLKWRLLWNGLKADRQRRVGLPFVIALLLWGGWQLAWRFRATVANLPTEAAGEFSLWAALALWLGWMVLPVVLFPLDETLDPGRFATLPISGRSLTMGMAAAGLVAPTVLLPLQLLGVDVATFGGGWWPLAVLGCALLLFQMVIGGHVFSAAVTAVLRSRRGRDLAMLIVSGIGLGAFGAQQVVSTVVGGLGMEGAVTTYRLSPWTLVVPPAAAQSVVVAASQQRFGAALLNLLIAAAWVVGLSLIWGRLIGHLVTTPEASPRPARVVTNRALAGSRGWTTIGVVARKELRFYLRDPRQRMVWTGALIFLGILVAAILVGTSQVALARRWFWLPLTAPAFVLFVGLPIALNQFGWERNAASYLFALPATPRQLILGKNLATTTALLVESILLSVLLAWVSGSWGYFPLVPVLCLSAIACQLAIGNLVSVITPLRLPEVGTDLFAQASEQGCLAIGSQVVSFFGIGLLLVPPAAVMVLTIAFGQQISDWFAVPFAIAWGGVFYLLSLWLSGFVLRRRIPEVVAWVQTV